MRVSCNGGDRLCPDLDLAPFVVVNCGHATPDVIRWVAFGRWKLCLLHGCSRHQINMASMQTNPSSPDHVVKKCISGSRQTHYQWNLNKSPVMVVTLVVGRGE